LKEYVTEFNFLFHQIHKCAAITAINDDNYTTFYNFGNTLAGTGVLTLEYITSKCHSYDIRNLIRSYG
jgi:hypothetical protein